MENPKYILGVDFSSKDMTVEVLAKHNPNGTVEIIDIFKYNKEITLSKSEYKINNPR